MKHTTEKSGIAKNQFRLKIEVSCHNLPGIRFCDNDGSVREPVYLGIQKNREIIDAVPADRDSVLFCPEFRVGYADDGSPNFLGPYAQGPANDRFFYLSWSVRNHSGALEMFRRLKIRLNAIGWDAIKRAAADNRPLKVRINLTDRCGAPLCATPPPSHLQWQLQ